MIDLAKEDERRRKEWEAEQAKKQALLSSQENQPEISPETVEKPSEPKVEPKPEINPEPQEPNIENETTTPKEEIVFNKGALMGSTPKEVPHAKKANIKKLPK